MRFLVVLMLLTVPALADQYVKNTRHSLGIVGGLAPNSVKLAPSGNVTEANIKTGGVIGAEYRMTYKHTYTKVEVISNYSVIVGAGIELW